MATELIQRPVSRVATLVAVLVILAGMRTAYAQAADPQQPDPTAAVTSADAEPQDDEAAAPDPAETDFVVVNIPTTLPLPLHKGNFRLTHRFAGNLRNGSFGQQAANLFGLDQGAAIGFEYRIGVVRHVQAAIYRTSFDKTFQFHGKYDALRQNASLPLSLSALVSVEGTDNFQDQYAPALGAVVSRKIARRLALYAAPIWVHNTAASLNLAHEHGALPPDAESHKNRDTFYIGLAGRARLWSKVYLVGEVSPRAAGYAPNDVEYGFGVEGRVGSHVFQLTFTNSSGTTFAQIARGGAANSLYLGFNLARKFF